MTQDPNQAAETVKSTMQSGPDFAPETQAGQRGMKTLGDLIEKGIDIVNFPISGLAGLVDLAATGDIEKASQMVADVQEKGLGQTLGDTTYDATGSPLAATAALMAPDVVGTIAGTQAAKTAAKSVGKAIPKNMIPRRAPQTLISTDGKLAPAFEKALAKQGATYDNIIDEIPRLPDGIAPDKAVSEIIKRKIRAGDTDG